VFAVSYFPQLTSYPRHRTSIASSAAKSQHAAGNTLVQQRLRRPLAPHLSIYKWQISSVPSTLMRITGVALSGSLYLFGVLYLASPMLGIDLSSAVMAASFGAWSVGLKVLTKAVLAWPFLFHSMNGLRYLCWDMAIGVNNLTVARTGWTVVVASFVSSLALATFV
jgi:succinate dehydrogenase (ubiquinone) cytochrome b560 subunit